MSFASPAWGIAVVLGLLGLTLFMLQRFGLARTTRGPRQMVVVERVSLGPGQTLSLVRVAERTLVIGASPKGIDLLLELSGGKQETP